MTVMIISFFPLGIAVAAASSSSLLFLVSLVLYHGFLVATHSTQYRVQTIMNRVVAHDERCLDGYRVEAKARPNGHLFENIQLALRIHSKI
jgi:hypothetical protein